MNHTLSVLVENKPGVLAKVAGLFARRGFNIHSLAVGPTDDPTASRMTIVVDLPGQPLEQVTKQLHKLISVLKVTELNPSYSVERELMLVKLAAPGAARAQVIELAEVFRAKVIDVSAGALTVEVTGTPDKLHAFEDLINDFDVIELVKTGRIALSRGSQGIKERQLKAAG